MYIKHKTLTTSAQEEATILHSHKIHAYFQTLMRTYIHTYQDTYIHTYIHTHI